MYASNGANTETPNEQEAPVANFEANMAYSKHLSDLDDLGRQVAAYITDARFGIRHGVASGMDSLNEAVDALADFKALADRLVTARESARIMAQVTGSRGATYIDDRNGDIVTAVWGEV